jgi:TonB-linked SusC/RagA family outer membrane protein
MKKFLLHVVSCLCLVFVFSIARSHAQTVIQGKITDVDNQPIPGVTVAEVDEDGRTIKADRTDVNGNFSIRLANKKHKLTISHIAHKTVELNIGDRTTFNVTLESNARELGDVVIVAQRRGDNGLVSVSEKKLTSSQSQINAKEVEEMQAASIDQALQGRLPGMDISASSGDPGAGMQIRIRGTSSINSSNDPLIIVDGMPYETTIPSDFNFGAADDVGYANLLNIAPADIDKFTILKDAAATAVWGSRGASGVIIITTKRGLVSKPVLTYTFQGSVLKQPPSIPMLNGNQYSTLIPEAYQNPAGRTLPQSFKEFQYDPNDPYWYNNYSKNTDWLGAITQNGISQNHSLAMRGGGQKARYYASIAYLNESGTTIGNNLDRLTTLINLDYNVSAKIKFSSNFAYTYVNNDKNYVNNIRDIAYRKMPNMSIFEYDEFGNNTGNYLSPQSNVQGSYSGTFNPVAMANGAKNNLIQQSVAPKFIIDYQIIKNILQAKVNVAFNINNTKNTSFLPQTATGRPANEPNVNKTYDGDNDAYFVGTISTLIYTPKFKSENHNLLTYIGLFTEDRQGVFHQATTTNTASSILQDPSSPSRTQSTEARLSSSGYQSRNTGVLLSGTYDFKEKYIVNGTVRRDGNSKFGSANKHGIFSTVSLGWRVSDEKFMKKIKSIDDLKFRVSYGGSGNPPRNDYSFYARYDALTSSGIAFSYLGQGGVYPSSPELSNLKWETVLKTDVGADLSMFKGRFIANLDFYKNVTKDQIFYGLTLPSITGFNTIDMNIGSLENQGFELGLNTIPFQNKTWQVNLDFNISSNQNVLTEISPLYPSTKGDVTRNGEYQTFLKLNNPFGSFYGYKFKGVYPDQTSTIAKDAKGQPIIGPTGQIVYMTFNYPSIGYVFQQGDAMYEDINHDGNINYQDVVYLGNSNPKFTGGFGASLGYKKVLKLSTFFNYRYDFDVINGTKITTTNMYNYDNQSVAVLRRWKKPGDVTDMPRALLGSGYNWLGSDRYVEDATFVRFRSVTLRFFVPKKTTDKMKIKNLSAYFTLENPYIWTNYSGQDPDVSPRGNDPFRVARDVSYTPYSKKFILGITAQF